jgi:NADPH-dependent 2,4-dienoyl-CoA reductase/sulfur reductase-like enzyme
MDNAEEIAFDRLLLATGASPKPLRIPGADLPNVFFLRSLDECDRLHHAIDKARVDGRVQPGAPTPARGRAVVVGNGLLAVETAASLRQIGLGVDLVAGRIHPWGKIAGEATGRFIAKFLEGRGIAVHPNISPDRFDGDGRIQRVVLSTGQIIDCDFAVVAVGITSNRELLRGTPIAAEKAILVDDHCRTSVEGIYAAGDCAAILDPLFGKHRVLDHWDSARVTGHIAGANMAGADLKYDTVNTFWSDVFELRLQAWGESRFVDRRLVRGTPSIDAPDFAEIGVASDGRVSQVLAIGRKAEHDLFRQLVQNRVNVTGHEEMLNDPARDLSALLT